MPSFVPPMLASSGRPQGSLDGWVVEPKADGWRVQVAVAEGDVTVWTRTGRDITARVPELATLDGLGVDCVVDGELVAGAGLPTDFYGIAGLVSSRSRRVPLTLAAFDVLAVSGNSLVDYDLASRREVLECLARLSDWTLTAVRQFPGADLDQVFDACEHLSLEGVVVKRQDSTYRPGRRTPHWRKIKCGSWKSEHGERRLKAAKGAPG